MKYVITHLTDPNNATNKAAKLQRFYNLTNTNTNTPAAVKPPSYYEVTNKQMLIPEIHLYK